MQRKKTNKTSMFPDTKKNLHKNQTQIRRQRPIIENLRQKPMAELIKDGIKVRNKLKLYHDTMNKKHSSVPLQSIPINQILESDITVYHPDFPINRDKPITTYSTFKPNAYQDQPFNKHHFKGWGENTHIPKQVEPLDLNIKPTTDHTIINIAQLFADQITNPYTNLSLFQQKEKVNRPAGFVDENVPDFLAPITHNNKEDDILLYELQTGLKSVSKENINRINQVLAEVQQNPGGAVNQILNQVIERNNSAKILDIIKEKNKQVATADDAKIWKFSDIVNPTTGLKTLVTMKLIENFVNNRFTMSSLFQSAYYLAGGSFVYWPGVFGPELPIMEANIGGLSNYVAQSARNLLPAAAVGVASNIWRRAGNVLNPFGVGI